MVAARGAGSVRKPEIRIHNATVIDGAWHLDFEIRARNRAEGWSVVPRLTLVGLDGGHQDIQWEQLDVDPPAEQLGETVVLVHKPRGRLLTTTARGVSTASLPIPASESAVDIRIARADVAPPSAQSSEKDIP